MGHVVIAITLVRANAHQLRKGRDMELTFTIHRRQLA